MRSDTAKKVAVGGVTAGLAVVIMLLGGMIPLATFICPVLCCILLWFVCAATGSTTGWIWYVAVSILGALLSPDKEAAAVFVFLGYYPIIKPRLDRWKLGIVLKLLLFNAATAAMYASLIWLFGMDQLLSEFAEAGTVLCVVMLVLGNGTFFALDALLKLLARKFSVTK